MKQDPQIHVTEARPRGRPRLKEEQAGVWTSLPVSAYDRLMAVAKREEQSISATVRQLLILRLPR